MPIKKVCPKCGSSSIARDAFARWDIATQQWVLGDVYDSEIWCQDCEETLSDVSNEESPHPPGIHITTPFADAEVAISDLSAPQRNALAELLGLRSAKAEVFKKLAELKPFQKISRETLQEASYCKGYPQEVKVKLTPIEAPEAVRMISEIMPEATCSPMMHTLSTACKRCGSTHYVERRSVLVRTVVAGVPFNKLYEV